MFPRYTTRYHVYNDGNNVRVSRHDADEFSTYSRSRDPSSGSFSDDRPSASRQSRQDTCGYPLQGGYAEYGHPMQGGYLGGPDLRRRLARDTGYSSSLYVDLRAPLGRSAGAYGAQDGYVRRSGLSEEPEVYGPAWRQETREQLKGIQQEFQEAIDRGRAAGDDSEDDRREQQHERRRAAHDEGRREQSRKRKVGTWKIVCDDGHVSYPPFEWR